VHIWNLLQFLRIIQFWMKFTMKYNSIKPSNIASNFNLTPRNSWPRMKPSDHASKSGFYNLETRDFFQIFFFKTKYQKIFQCKINGNFIFWQWLQTHAGKSFLMKNMKNHTKVTKKTLSILNEFKNSKSQNPEIYTKLQIIYATAKFHSQDASV